MTDLPLPLLAWLSPAFPVGAFAYSHGLEWAHEAGDIKDAATLRNWLRDIAEFGSLRTDIVLLSVAHRATLEENSAALTEVAELAQALAPSPERRLETVQQGNSFMRIARDAWPCEAHAILADAWNGDVAYPVALGVTAAGHRVSQPSLLRAFGLAFLSNLVSAAIRLGIIGQTDGQRVIAALLPLIESAAQFAAACDARSTWSLRLSVGYVIVEARDAIYEDFPLMSTVIAKLILAVLLPIAVLHIAWGFGVTWPCASEADLARMVVGRRGITRMPSLISCLIASAGIALFAVWPMLMSHRIDAPLSDGLIQTIAMMAFAIFLGRGLVTYTGLASTQFSEEPFATLDRRLYAPLCLVVAAGYAMLLFGWR